MDWTVKTDDDIRRVTWLVNFTGIERAFLTGTWDTSIYNLQQIQTIEKHHPKPVWNPGGNKFVSGAINLKMLLDMDATKSPRMIEYTDSKEYKAFQLVLDIELKRLQVYLWDMNTTAFKVWKGLIKTESVIPHRDQRPTNLLGDG